MILKTEKLSSQKKLMKPKRIILIRHGESEGNINKKVYREKPDYTLLLTETGISQAQHLGEKLLYLFEKEHSYFYVSPFWRTRMTFENIVKCFPREQFSYNEEPRIREQEWGHLRTVSEIEIIEKERKNYGSFYYRIPDGESAADLYDRVSDFFDTLFRDFEYQDFPENALIITHGMSIRVFLMRWFHWTVEEFESYKNPGNCDMYILEKQENGKYELITPLKLKVGYSGHSRPIKLEHDKH